MLRGLYTAGAGMISQQRKQEMLTNNMANVNTPGYKADQGSLRTFPNMMIQAMGTDHQISGRSPIIGELSTGVYMQEGTPNFRQGDLRETNNSTDIALLQADTPIDDETGLPAMLAFQVQNDDGEPRYTRNGDFTIDSDGFLTMGSGHYVLGVDGDPIEVGNENFRVNQNGEIFTDDAEEELLGQLDVLLIPDSGQLVKEGNGFLRYDGDEEIASIVGDDDILYQLQQGYVERSNVDAGQTMTEMMAALRNFEANQKVLQAYDQSLERAVNDIGRLR
ncbi:flagellar hook-basal body protein [Salisediminibacterium beveridgei]|uniref:Flagellar basal-body rod protein FlgF n=1 Tax=Salisediminibacterium beveridgei TaxID=632773 RepID=A0A1D7QRH6_9BACI|nr:flagellar hook-basal body protein [Salisediminibacterium beveridgei]AOM81607.1 Flagellar basal-body rod protein FlgF [Salisediminibacterium beveridgei]